MTSPAQRVLEVIVIDPRWRLELRQEVPDCFNNDKRNKGVSFYKFPKDKELKKIWLQKISRKDFKLTNGHRVCSQHFEGKKTYGGGHWGVLETAKPKKKSSKSAKPQKNSAKTENRIQNRQKTDTVVTSAA